MEFCISIPLVLVLLLLLSSRKMFFDEKGLVQSRQFNGQRNGKRSQESNGSILVKRREWQVNRDIAATMAMAKKIDHRA